MRLFLLHSNGSKRLGGSLTRSVMNAGSCLFLSHNAVKVVFTSFLE